MEDLRLTADFSANVVGDVKIREGMNIVVVVSDDCIHVFASQ